MGPCLVIAGCVSLSAFIAIAFFFHRSIYPGLDPIARALTQPICFAVVTAVVARPADGNMTIPCVMALSSVAEQSYRNWLLVVIGDGLNQMQAQRTIAMLQRLVPPNKYMFQNMPEKLREINFYNGSVSLWQHAGTNALNMGLRIAYGLGSVTHIARIDDDDYWHRDHLSNLKNVYELIPNATFAHTQALGYTPLPFPQLNKTVLESPPVPCGMIHATASWSTKLRMYYHQAWEQEKFPRHSEPCCSNGTCRNGTILAADADLWERIRGMVRTGLVNSVIYQKADVFYSSQDVKLCFPALQQLGQGSHCDQVLYYVNPRNQCNASNWL
jgi:hypothetical protein